MRKLFAALTAVGLGLTTFSAFAPTAGAAPPPGTTTHRGIARDPVPRAAEPAREQATGAQGEGDHRRHRRSGTAAGAQRQHRRQGR